MTEGEYKKNIADFIKEIAPKFERSSIIAELELKNQDYSISDIKMLYENGIGALNSLSFEGGAMDALLVCTAGYSVLMRLGIGKDEYIEWAERQGFANVYILERVVGMIDKAWEAAFVTIYVKYEIDRLRSNNARAMLVPTDEVTVLSLFGQNVAVTEKMLIYLDAKREIFSISESAVKQFETEYNTSIKDYRSLQKNLMMVIQDAAELALDEIEKYLIKKKCESRYEFIEKKYLDMIAENNPYTLMLEGLEQVCNQYQSKAVKNEVDRLKRESVHFVGGGFGIRGFVAGTVMAKAANSAVGAFNGAVSGINSWLNDTRMQSNLDKLANNSKQKQMYKESIQKNILALENAICDALCPTDNMDVIMDEYFTGSCQEVTLPPMLLNAAPSALQEVLYLSLLKQPFTGYLKVAFDIFGDKNNELEILAGCTGQTDFLKYKYEKTGKKEEIPRFPLIEEIISNKELIDYLNTLTEVKKVIQDGEWSYETAGERIEKLNTAYVQVYTNVSPEYKYIFDCYFLPREEEVLQMLQNHACVAENRSYVNYFEAYLMIRYAEKFEDIYTKYTLNFVRDFVDEDFDQRRQYLLKLKKEKLFFSKYYFILSSKKLQDYVNQLIEKICFAKYMSKNPAILGGKSDYDFSSLFQARFRELLKTAKKISSKGAYKWGGEWSNSFLENIVSEYDYHCKDKDIRKTIGEPCGQYIFFHQMYWDSENEGFENLVLTDQFLYLGEKKFTLQQLTTISDYVGLNNGRKIFLHLGEERIPCADEFFESDSLLPQFYNTIRHSMPDLENEPKYPEVVTKCLICGSDEIKFGKLGAKCKACGASESVLKKKSIIGYFDAYGPFRDKAESVFKCVKGAPYDKWCRELME